MELLPVDSEERLAKAKKVWDQLEARNKEISAHLRDLDNLLEKDNEDAYSDLSDPFSDMGDSELAKPANRKRMSKLESDTLLMSSFTPEFMNVQEELLKGVEGGPPKMYREELGTRSYDYLVDLPQEQDERLKRMMEDLLNTCRLPSPEPVPMLLPEEDPGKPKGGVASPDNKFMMKPTQEINETNSLSEVWRMLEVQSTSNGFPVSPLGYNVFDDKRMGWLKRETGTWGEQEASRQKCEEWLKKL